MDKELIRVEKLKKYYDIKGGIITHTVSQVQADVENPRSDSF